MKKILLLSFILLGFIASSLSAQDQTVGLFSYEEGSMNGYTLFAPFQSTSTYLIDNCGRKVHKWESTSVTAAATVLLENGNLLRTASNGMASNPTFMWGGAGESIQEVDWDGNIVWEFIYSDSTHRLHHDFARKPNGNLLIPVWELKTEEEAIAAGRNPDLLVNGVLWAEYIIEFVPASGEIVWEWHMWDHLIQDFDETKDNYGVIADHPELFNINVTGGPTADGGKNWLHFNSIDYNPMMNQILINSFFVSEFFILDQSTTTAQAAAHVGGNSGQGGDLIYRWGNPQNYDHGSADDRTIFGSHNAHWVPNGLQDEGQIMFFNNGNGRTDGSYSSVDIIIPPVDDYITGQYIYETGVAYAPLSTAWSYTEGPTDSFYSSFLSGTQRLSNGNTIICSGANGRFFEINESKEIVWEYINPVASGGIISQGDTIPLVNGRKTNSIFRSPRYGTDYLGLADVDLTPGDPIEANFTMPYDCEIISNLVEPDLIPVSIYPNPANDLIQIESPFLKGKNITLFNALGNILIATKAEENTFTLDIAAYPSGLYLIAIEGIKLKKFVIEH